MEDNLLVVDGGASVVGVYGRSWPLVRVLPACWAAPSAIRRSAEAEIPAPLDLLSTTGLYCTDECILYTIHAAAPSVATPAYTSVSRRDWPPTLYM